MIDRDEITLWRHSLETSLLFSNEDWEDLILNRNVWPDITRKAKALKTVEPLIVR